VHAWKARNEECYIDKTHLNDTMFNEQLPLIKLKEIFKTFSMHSDKF